MMPHTVRALAVPAVNFLGQGHAQQGRHRPDPLVQPLAVGHQARFSLQLQLHRCLSGTAVIVGLWVKPAASIGGIDLPSSWACERLFTKNRAGKVLTLSNPALGTPNSP